MWLFLILFSLQFRSPLGGVGYCLRHRQGSGLEGGKETDSVRKAVTPGSGVAAANPGRSPSRIRGTGK